MSESNNTPQGELALAFANAVAYGNYEVAYGMLSVFLKLMTSPSQLEREFEEMIEYGEGRPDSVSLMTHLERWPAKEAEDIGWAYVSICGAGFCEAVSVVVACESSRFVIREIDWGRP
jgi:hypothetical protein